MLSQILTQNQNTILYLTPSSNLVIMNLHSYVIDEFNTIMSKTEITQHLPDELIRTVVLCYYSINALCSIDVERKRSWKKIQQSYLLTRFGFGPKDAYWRTQSAGTDINLWHIHLQILYLQCLNLFDLLHLLVYNYFPDFIISLIRLSVFEVKKSQFL